MTPLERVRQVATVERRLLGLLRPHRRAVAAGLGVTLASTLVGLAQPWPTKVLVDDVLGAGGASADGDRIFGLGREGALLVTVGATVLLFLLSGALGLLQTRLLFGLAQRLISDLRTRLFEHVAHLPLRFHDQAGTGDTTYRLTNDTYAVQSVLLDGLVPLASAALALVGTLVVMVVLDPALALLALVSVPLAAVATARFGARIRSVSVAVHERESEVLGHAEQALSSIRTVQAFGRERHEAARFGRRADGSRAAMVRLVTIQTVFGLVVDLILSLGLALVTWVAARRAIAGELTTGEVLVLLAYAGSLYGPVSSLTTVAGELAAAAAGAGRVFEVLDEERPHDPPAPAVALPRAVGHLALEDVTFGYEADHPVLHGVALAAGPGELVALVGPTGAGKSTIASLLLRLYEPDAGRVLLDGVDTRTLPLAHLRAQVAYVPQDPALFPVSVRENIRYGRLDATDADVEQAARDANVLDELLADPRGLDAPLGDGGVTLSGGQRQRVAIARAFLRDAPILVLDEPTSALDAGTEALVMEALARLRTGRTCIVIAHRLATVRQAKRIVVLDAGCVVQAGSHRQLIRRRGLYRQLHDARFGADVGTGAGAA